MEVTGSKSTELPRLRRRSTFEWLVRGMRSVIELLPPKQRAPVACFALGAMSASCCMITICTYLVFAGEAASASAVFGLLTAAMLMVSLGFVTAIWIAYPPREP